MVAHNFDVSPDQCLRCQERSRNHKPATVPGVIDPDRLAAILALPSARGREKTARHLAAFDIAVHVVAAVLTGVPRDDEAAKAANSLGFYLQSPIQGRPYR